MNLVRVIQEMDVMINCKTLIGVRHMEITIWEKALQLINAVHVVQKGVYMTILRHVLKIQK